MKEVFIALKRVMRVAGDEIDDGRTIFFRVTSSAYENDRVSRGSYNHLKTDEGLAHELQSAPQHGCEDKTHRLLVVPLNVAPRLNCDVSLRRLAAALLLCATVSGCASLPSPTSDPNACVGPPGYCVPFFGS